jgi:hypothetical protein
MMKLSAHRLGKYLDREVDEAKQDLKEWARWNKRHRHEGAPNPNPSSLSGKIFIVGRGEQPVPDEIRRIARVIWFLGDNRLKVLWRRYVLNEYIDKYIISEAEIKYAYLRKFWPDEWPQELTNNDFF